MSFVAQQIELLVLVFFFFFVLLTITPTNRRKHSGVEYTAEGAGRDRLSAHGVPRAYAANPAA